MKPQPQDAREKAKYYGDDSSIPSEVRPSLYREWTEYRDYLERDPENICADIADFRTGFVRGYNAARRDDWALCAERLPEKLGPYLFTFAFHSENGEQFGGKRIVEELYYANGMWFVDEDDYQADPDDGQPFKTSQYIAWRSLPEPYTAGDEK